jgi:hypothetical protein
MTDCDTERLWDEFLSNELTLEQEASRLAVLARREGPAIRASKLARVRAANKYQRGGTVGEDNRGPCEICGRVPGPGQRSNCWDHDHSSEKFRGWLCVSCNLGLGYFKDSEDRLTKAIEYLKKQR